VLPRSYQLGEAGSSKTLTSPLRVRKEHMKKQFARTDVQEASREGKSSPIQATSEPRIRGPGREEGTEKMPPLKREFPNKKEKKRFVREKKKTKRRSLVFQAANCEKKHGSRQRHVSSRGSKRRRNCASVANCSDQHHVRKGSHPCGEMRKAEGNLSLFTRRGGQDKMQGHQSNTEASYLKKPLRADKERGGRLQRI